MATATWLRISGATFALAAAAAAWPVWQMYDRFEESLDIADKIEAARHRDGSEDYATAMRYLNGDGVAKDLREAVGYLERSAQDGYALAQYQLGVMLREGNGAVADQERAFTWLRMAAEAGDARAQLEIGAMYLDGKGTAPDRIQGYAWANLAAAQGIVGAGDVRDLALVSMTPPEVAYARAEARRLIDNRLPGGVSVQF